MFFYSAGEVKGGGGAQDDSESLGAVPGIPLPSHNLRSMFNSTAC